MPAAEQTPLFEVPVTANPLPRRIQAVRREHGLTDGETCAGCAFLFVVQHLRRFFKCSESRVGSSAATDRRKAWPACGPYRAGDQTVIRPAKS